MKLFLAIVLLWTSSVECQQRGLFPAILNLASNAEITANATCGEEFSEMYCKLVEHVPGQRISNPQCGYCNARSTNPKERHPITNAIDGTNQWWQSPSIKNGRQFHWITITLDLRQIFQVAYIIIKVANSPRPGNWILERSLDGVEFKPWQYYAISDTECLTRYNITPRVGPPTYKKDDEVICTSYYSKLNPLERGEIHTSLINDRPGASERTPEILDFTSARFIRLRLQRIRTLNADLMTLSYRDPKEVDPIVTRRYYYTLKDISVGGMCICYGHAQSCPVDPVTKKHQCVCEHNTCGASCNECCPGYHQQLWQPGTNSAGNTCEKCNCHGKAEDCYYNQTVAELRQSMNTHGQFLGGGVCISCTQNTAGVNCETCADRYFRPHKVSPYANNPCVECSCDMRGSHSPVCIRDDKHASLEQGLTPGQCPCKEGFAGQRCDRCAFGYRDFPLCTRCECRLDGSVNADPCDECVCKANVMGAHCDLCKPGFFNLQGANPEGCTECFCFGVSDVCESLLWSTSQVEERNGWLVPTTPSTSIYTAPLMEDNLIVPSNVTSYRFLSTWAAPESFLGNRLTSYGGFLKSSVAYDIAVENVDKTLPSHFDLIIEGNGRSFRQSPSRRVLLTPLREQEVSVEVVPQSFVDLHTGRRVQRDELMTVLADVASLRIRAYLNTSAEGALRLSQVSLDTANRNSSSFQQAVGVEQCECPWGYSGTSCEYCISGFYRVDGILFGGNCLQCECNDHATECDISGVCVGCTHNTTGPHCDQCLPGFYGDPFEGSAADCQRCACPLTVASNNFSPTCSVESSGEVTCDQCQTGYTGPKCERCDDGYYGDPTVPGQGCVPCECNGNVDPTEAGHCNSTTGECLKCVGHTAGPSCERCADGYYGDAIMAKNCQACGCHGNGSLASVCDMVTGRCVCRDHVQGEKCDRCEVGFHGLLSGEGCVPCNCSQSGSTSVACDEGGRCQCISSVAGDKCDRCQQGYYNLQDGGCTPCDCAHTHGNCNSETGECICPPHTKGDKCERCEENHWGHDPLTGCKACECSETGSASSQCHLTTGRCPCLASFDGQRCDRCAMGFKDFPQCTACNCNINGTQEKFCDQKLGVCSCEEQGICMCKANVGGGGCDECKQGTFGLAADNPSGCSPCFCFGVSSDCEEMGGLVRTPLTLGVEPERLPVVTQSNLQGVLEGVYVQDAEMLLDASQLQNSPLTGPYYWRLPAHFQGHKLLSYGGQLSYSVVFYAMDGAGLANHEPQVLIRGGHLKKVVIYIDMPAPENGRKTRQEVPLTEHKWKYFNSVSEKPVSHSDFMSVLSNIEYIIIKASYGTDLQQSRIANISMDMAIDAEDGPEFAEVARLIESCECPRGYAGLSCQECAPGYYRQPASELNMKGPRRPLIQPCVPCRCNNHSLACDLDTGECLGCQHHTAGERCHLCAQGYYGSVRGSASDCSLCACPLQANSFSPSCVLEGVGDYRCTACQPGYEGRYCERCSVGYYGNPSEPGGRCQPCQCSAVGSVHQVCHHLTGQCDCKAGVRGHTCEECEARHALIQDQCVSCDDACTGVLLDDMDALDASISSVNLTGIILAPFTLLVSLENQTREIQDLMSWEKSPSHELNKAEIDMRNFTEQIDDLEEKAKIVSKYGEEVIQSTEERITHGNKLLVFINKTHATIQALKEEVARLNETAKEDKRSVTNSTVLQEQVEAMLEQMRGINFTNATAVPELSEAVAILEEVQKQIAKPHQAIEAQTEAIARALSNHTHQLQEAQTLIATARQQNNHTSQVLSSISTTLDQYSILKYNVSNLTQEVTSQMAEAQDLLTDALSISGDMDNITSALEETRDELEIRSPALRKHVDTLVMQLTRRDALQLVYRAEDHAQALRKEAEALNRSLSAMRQASENATGAALASSNIRADVRAAEESALVAAQDATHALNQTHSEGPASEQGARALQRSRDILEESHRLSNYSDGLLLNLTDVTDRLGVVRADLRNLSQLVPEASTFLKDVPRADQQLQEVKEQVEGVNASLLKALGQLEHFQVKLEQSSSTVAEANSTARNTNEMVTDSETTTNEAASRLSEVERRAEHLFDRLKPLKTLGENLSRNLSEIREMISQARRQAASIKVAVLAEHDCVRAYKPEVSSSNINTITLTMKTTEPDNLLFYLGSSSAVDFMALEMRHGKLSFMWDAGSGHAKLEYPDVQINNNKWQRINATRFGKHGTLTVQQLDSAPLPPVKGSAPGSSTVMDITKDSWVFVGGLGGQVKKPSAVKLTQFKGCMGEASLNEKNVGLWNYAEREGQCRGCFKSPQAEETSFHFDGSGYSVVEKSLRSTATSIVMFFKTLSPNGLLLYLASNGTRDFLSIELVDGKVRLTFELGSGPLTMTTTKAYNTGTWYKIALQRNKRKGYLAVMAADNPSEREVTEAESPGAASDLNRSDLDPIYIGGLPKTRPIRRQVVARSYVGCIKNVEIARTNFDLLRDSYGVKKGCVLEPIRSMSVLGGGFLQMPSISLDPQMELMATFSTRNESGLVLSGFGKMANRKRRQTHQPFLAAMLVSGQLEVHVNMAEGGTSHKAVIRSSTGTFADGQEHSVILQRNKRTMHILVDEDHQASVRLGSATDKGSLILGHFYIGGVPPGEGSSVLPTTSFYGCIRNIALDAKLLDLSSNLRYEGVDMDSCLLEERPRRVVLPDESDLEAEPTPDPAKPPQIPPTELGAITPGSTSCATMDDTATLAESHQFGVSRSSHMILAFKNRTVRTSFSVKLSVRTFAGSGVLLYMANANQQDYAALQLLGGRLLLTCDLGKGPATAALPTLLNDGLWHTVKAEFGKKSVMISVDGEDSARVQVKGHTLDVEGKLYLGGLPATYTARRIGNVTHSLAGCVQGVLLNGAKMNLNRPLSAHATGACFSSVQDGTFFNGSGHAAFVKDGYNVGSDVTVTLEFRSTGLDGVLLGISSAKVDAIGLELANGQVVFNVNNGAGRISASTRSSRWFCDGRWHTVVAKKLKSSISITVDGLTITTSNPYLSSTSAETKNPVYVGGHPANVKQNCLTTRTAFQGCMRNLRVYKGHVTDVLDFGSAFFLHGVSPNSCPGRTA